MPLEDRPCPRCGDLTDGRAARCPGCGAHIAIRPPTKGRKVATARHDLTPRERRQYGCVVTATNGRDIETLTRPGLTSEALEAICAELDGWPGAWRIRSISTPTTISRDLQGIRQNIDQPSQHWNSPEATMLGKIGRGWMLEESRR